MEIDLLGINFSNISIKFINLWLETKNMDVLFSWDNFLVSSSNLFFDFGTNPKKVNSDNGKPDSCKLDIIDDGPGIDVNLILFLIQYWIKL